jgi:hypothetical protein
MRAAGVTSFPVRVLASLEMEDEIELDFDWGNGQISAASPSKSVRMSMIGRFHLATLQSAKGWNVADGTEIQLHLNIEKIIHQRSSKGSRLDI